ncbi:hypothetical protein X011_12415 [Mycobacterium tuberculosis variant microti OV254]|nr:hypothetical protein X011_12415 [Mycobacterium tuberculosis variant microti OV254]
MLRQNSVADPFKDERVGDDLADTRELNTSATR